MEKQVFTFPQLEPPVTLPEPGKFPPLNLEAKWVGTSHGAWIQIYVKSMDPETSEVWDWVLLDTPATHTAKPEFNGVRGPNGSPQEDTEYWIPEPDLETILGMVVEILHLQQLKEQMSELQERADNFLAEAEEQVRLCNLGRCATGRRR